MSLIFWKIKIFFLLKFSSKLIRVPPLYQAPLEKRVQKVILFEIFQRYIKYTIKNEFNFMKINGFFYLEIFKQVDKGPLFESTTHRTDSSESNFIRDILTKIYSFKSMNDDTIQNRLPFLTNHQHFSHHSSLLHLPVVQVMWHPSAFLVDLSQCFQPVTNCSAAYSE